MKPYILACFLLSSAESDLIDSEYSGIGHYDYNQWRPVYRGKEGSYEHNLVNNDVKKFNIVFTDANADRRDDDGDSATRSSIVENIRKFLFTKIDNYATNFVRFAERWYGPEAEVSYDLKSKTVKAFGIDFDILFALDQFFLVLTEFWAYVTTDIVFRMIWPE